MMGVQANLLADEFDVARRRFVEAVSNISDEDWLKVASAENWTVGVVAHHVAASYELATEVLQALSAGESRPMTSRMLDEINAEHAKTHANCTREETVQLLRANGENASAVIRELSDLALSSHHDLPFMGDEHVSMEQFVRISFIAHHDAHLVSIQNCAPYAFSSNAC